MIKYFTLIGLLCATSIKSQVFTWTARTDAQKICLYLSDSARISFKNGFPPYTYYYVLQHGTTLSGTTSDSAAIALQTQAPGIDTFVLQHVTDGKNVVHQINDTLYSTINDRLSINNTNLLDTICSNTNPRLVLTVCNCYNDTAAVTYEWADSLFNGHVKGYSPDTGSNVIDQVLINQSDSLLGTVVYYVTPVSAAGCPSSYPTPFSITVKPSPVVTNTNLLNTVCSGAAIKIALSASTGAGATFSWTDSLVGSNISGGSAGSDKTSINQTLINSSNASPGSITYNVTALSAAGCVSASPIPITVLVNPLPVVTSKNSFTLCSGGSPNIALTASTGASTAFTWLAKSTAVTGASAGAGTVINDVLTNTGHTSAGKAVYSVTATSAVGCQAAEDTAITVVVNPVPVPAIFTLAAPQGICEATLNQNVSVKTSDPANANLAITNWQVLPAGGTGLGRLVDVSSSNLNAIVSFYTGTVHVQVTETNSATPGSCPALTDTAIKLSNITQDTAQVIFNGTDYVCLLNTADSYLWGFDSVDLKADTVADAIMQNYQIGTLPRNQHYWVVTSSGSCYTKDYYNPDIVSGDSAVIVQPGSQLHISVTPNPAPGMVKVTWNTPQQQLQVLAITDVNGKKLMEQEVSSLYINGETMLDVSRLPAGIYFITLRGGGQKAVAKLLKQ